MGKDIQERNAEKFIRLLERSGLEATGRWFYCKLKADGYMDLSIDRLATHPDGSVRFALAHNGKLNGDVMADPDMGVTFYPGAQPRLQATHYQNDYVGVFDSIERWEGYAAKQRDLQGRLDHFLATWLSNLLEQGHRVSDNPSE